MQHQAGALTSGRLLDLMVAHGLEIFRGAPEGTDAVLREAYSASADEFHREVGQFWDDARIVGDPHLPGPMMAAELRTSDRRVVWKPGEHRFRVENAFQEMVAALPGSMLAPVPLHPAWKGVEAEFVEALPKTEESFPERCRALAHLFVLVSCFGFSDLHDENLLWTAGGLAVVDAETFGVSEGFLPTIGRPEQTAMNRLVDTVAYRLLEQESPSGHKARAAETVLSFVDEAVARVTSCWDQLLHIRRRLEGGRARLLLRHTAEYGGLGRYALDPTWHEHLHEVLGTSPLTAREPLESLMGALTSGAIPRYEVAITSAGVIEPEIVGRVLRAWLGGIRPARALEMGADPGTLAGLEDLLAAVRIEGSSGPSFVAPERLGFDLANLNLVDLSRGLTGIVDLDLARKACGLAPLLDERRLREVLDAVEVGVLSTPARYIGINQGHGAIFVHAWMCREFGSPSLAVEQFLAERVCHAEDFPLVYPEDFFVGLPGLCAAAARMKGVLPVEPLLARAKPVLERAALEFVEDFDTMGAELDQKGLVQPGAALESGLAHGLAGLAYGLHATATALGEESEALAGAMRVLGDRVGPNALMDTEMDICRGRGGIMGVMARVLGGHALGQCFRRDEDLAGTTRARGHGLCHGDAAVAAALGYWPNGTLERDSEMDLLPPFGLLGTVGAAYARLAWRERLPNPLWGGRMGEIGMTGGRSAST